MVSTLPVVKFFEKIEYIPLCTSFTGMMYQLLTRWVKKREDRTFGICVYAVSTLR